MELVRVDLLAEDGRPIVIRKRRLDGGSIVLEVKYKGVVLLWVCPVEARQRLHCLDARERLVHIHGVQERLVVAGLELVGADQEAVRVALNLLGDVAARKAVERGLADLRPVVVVLAGERDDRVRGQIPGPSRFRARRLR